MAPSSQHLEPPGKPGRFKVSGAHKLSQYTLAKKWKLAKDGNWHDTGARLKDQAPQVLFIERCIQLLRPGGRLGIVLPESLFGMPIYGYLVQYLLTNFTLRAFISLPEEVFQPYTHAKTCVVILENTPPTGDYPIEMAIADWCGHDSRGNETIRVQPDGTEIRLDDLPEIAQQLSRRLTWS